MATAPHEHPLIEGQRPALLRVNHPLAYGAQPLLGNTPQSTEDKVTYLFERQRVTDLLNEYMYVLDTCMVDRRAATTWANLFTEDCSLTFPFGTHHGIPGLAEWCLQAETRFERMMHTSANLAIKFESEDVAYGRSTLYAVCGSDKLDLGKTFAEGGYYYWTFKKIDEQWKIAYLFLDANWTSGDALGLNENWTSAKDD